MTTRRGLSELLLIGAVLLVPFGFSVKEVNDNEMMEALAA